MLLCSLPARSPSAARQSCHLSIGIGCVGTDSVAPSSNSPLPDSLPPVRSTRAEAPAATHAQPCFQSSAATRRAPERPKTPQRVLKAEYGRSSHKNREPCCHAWLGTGSAMRPSPTALPSKLVMQPPRGANALSCTPEASERASAFGGEPACWQQCASAARTSLRARLLGSKS